MGATISPKAAAYTYFIRQLLFLHCLTLKVKEYMNFIEIANKMQPCSRIYYSNAS